MATFEFEHDFTTDSELWSGLDDRGLLPVVDTTKGFLDLLSDVDQDHWPYLVDDTFAGLPASYQMRCVLESVRAAPSRGFGLVYCRSQDWATRFRFLISGDGGTSVFVNRDGVETPLVPWTQLPVIHQGLGARNELLVEVWPNRQRFTINGVAFATVDVPAATPTGIGFVVPPEGTLRIHSLAVVPLDVAQQDMQVPGQRPLEELVSELDRLVGMPEIKDQIRTLMNVVRVQQRRQELGVSTAETGHHMVLTGPPGTGKTTVARMVGEIFHRLGVLTKGHLVETDRAGLVAGFVGQTSEKVDEIVNAARGGVLFIDEAYALKRSDSPGNDYGQEVIDILLKRMEDLRDDLIVIIAGYPDEMGAFLNANPGMRSRFNRFFNFDHYTPTELYEIFELLVTESQYSLTNAAQEAARAHLQSAFEARDRSFGNGRYARSLLEKAIELQANRLMADDDLDHTDVTTIEVQDIETQLLGDMVALSKEPPSNSSYL